MSRSIVVLALLSLWLAPASASAQACAPGRVITDATQGHCCWPAQSWSAADDRCEGPPACPEGYGGDGATCVSLTALEPQSIPDAPTPTSTPSLALALGSPLGSPPAPAIASPSAPPSRWAGRVNHNVIGGAVALFLTTYLPSVVMGLFVSGSCVGPIPFLVPLGSFAAPSCGAVYGTIGVTLGVGQIISIVLMAAGGTIFRRRSGEPSVALSAEGLSITF